MDIINLPTGKLFVADYEKGQLETLSIGDYGKEKNIKADFLGYTRELNGVPNGEIKPLSEKWVITLSTQYGCPMKCTFCDVPNVHYKGNVSLHDMYNQLFNAISLYPNVTYAERLNIHFARMGEGSFNYSTLALFARTLFINKGGLRKETGLRVETLHPVFTTMAPKGVDLDYILNDWASIKNVTYNGQAGLQLSINSTDENQRNEMFQNMQTSLDNLAKVADTLPDPVGRKYCLNFALADEYQTNGWKLANYFDPDKWMVKITPIHNNNACSSNNIQTLDGYNSFTPYKAAEESFKEAGFDVLVFIPSMDEEKGCITCGNAILGGSKIEAILGV